MAADTAGLAGPVHGDRRLPHIVVVEPHMDDAALSVGGRLLLRRGRARATILSVVRWSNYTRQLMHGGDPLEVHAVTTLRLAEAARAASALGARHEVMDEMDAPLRFRPAEEWSKEALPRLLRAFEAWTAFGPSREEVAGLAARLRARLAALAPDELWFPLGAGWNVDHAWTRDACLTLLAGLRLPFGFRVHLYEDVPYAHRSRAQVAQIVAALERAGCALTRDSEDVGRVFDEKLGALSAFGSQHDLAACERDVRAAARGAGDGKGFAEISYELAGAAALPAGPSPFRARFRQRLRPRLRSWAPEADRCPQLFVVGLSPFGRFEFAMRLLLGAFPRARVRVLVPPSSTWETEAFHDERVEVRVVGGGLWGWVKALARELPSTGKPTLIVTRFAPPLAALLPFRPRLCSRWIGDVCSTLGDVLGQLQPGVSSIPE